MSGHNGRWPEAWGEWMVLQTRKEHVSKHLGLDVPLAGWHLSLLAPEIKNTNAAVRSNGSKHAPASPGYVVHLLVMGYELCVDLTSLQLRSMTWPHAFTSGLAPHNDQLQSPVTEALRKAFARQWLLIFCLKQRQAKFNAEASLLPTCIGQP